LIHALEILELLFVVREILIILHVPLPQQKLPLQLLELRPLTHALEILVQLSVVSETLTTQVVQLKSHVKVIMIQDLSANQQLLLLAQHEI